MGKPVPRTGRDRADVTPGILRELAASNAPGAKEAATIYA